MATLHVLSASPFASDHFAGCLPLLGAGDGLLLCGDAVYALRAATAQRRQLEQLAPEIALFALAEDVEARALGDRPARVALLDYPGFVELCGRFERVNSWL
ncbi:MAG: sulfurtransferase complex subunit TusB [Pseudomonas sp.]|jgi:tRNA 2-thiouridine synthesizing protein B|uniref:sulfurtransferase complex subunit TusB n=1 Tax=Pseudomonas sp. FIP_A4 TaxID=3070684 RepID=UPI0010FF918F|nr:sulfurtransferase complex subunit TusB [Pseudomonas sp.]MCQ4234135.1 sulfurtransferase complex subunit TusB [Stutzerimonas degradans]MDT3709632.1 sulfurtransferase complex subunit TusB [Pseudomonadaceae bacterium]MEB2327999.1 sulfurtransferase complex subunit TusB [Pseudomonas sp.]QCT96356.1 sulfurtransferase complex subunit TusB [Stutzerimonas degradans]